MRCAHRLDGVGNAHQHRTLHAFTNPLKKVEIHFIPLTLCAKRALLGIPTEEGCRSKEAALVAFAAIVDDEDTEKKNGRPDQFGKEYLRR